MTTLVNVRNTNTKELLSQNEFKTKKEATQFIKTLKPNKGEVVYGLYKFSGKYFYTKFN